MPGRTAHLATTGGRDKVKTRPRQNPTAPRICASRELPIQAKVPVQSASVIGTTRRGGLASSDIVRQANGLLALSSCWRTPPDWPRADTYISKDRCLFVPFTFFPFNHLQMARSTTPFLRIPSIFMGMCGRFFLLYPLPTPHPSGLPHLVTHFSHYCVAWPRPHISGNFLSHTLVPISKRRPAAGREATFHVQPQPKDV